MSTSAADLRSHSLSQVTQRTPVLFWAVVGAAFLCLAAYVMISWLFSPEFKPAPVGVDPLPHNIWLTVTGFQLVIGTAALYVIYRFILRPWARNGELSLDGLLVLNFLALWWTDPLDNYVALNFFYNAHLLNMGSWANFIPGWGSPNAGNLPEPVVMMTGFYTVYWIVNVLLGGWFLSMLQRNFGNLSLAMRLSVLFVVLMIVDIGTELVFMRAGVAAYSGVINSMSIFAGKVYQWPLYEAVINAGPAFGFICLRYFRDDKGRTFVEKGLDRVQTTPRKKKLLTFLALAGFIQPFFLLSYYVPYNAFAMHADTMPAYPSYMRSGMCGDGTQYACTSYEWVPIPQRGGHNFIGPDDPKLPQWVRDQQGIKPGNDPYAWK